MKLSVNEEKLTGFWAKLPGLSRNGALALALSDGGKGKIVVLLRFIRPWTARITVCVDSHLLALVTSSILTVKDNFIS